MYNHILNVIKPETWNLNVRSVIASQVFYSKHSNYFFYTYILYEAQAYGGVLPPKIAVMDFLPNIYEIKNGKILRVLDILRLIIVLLIMLTGAVYFWRQYEKGSKLPEEERSSLVSLFFKTSAFSDFFVFVFYIICFVYKITNLSVSLEESLIFADLKVGAVPFYMQNNFEFFNLLMAFETQIILECLLVFGSLFKLMNLFVLFTRVKVFFAYLLNAFARVFSYFLLVLFLIISFSFFSNNLWGAHFEQYRDLAGSLTATLLLSIGHFNTDAFSLNFTIWNVIYIFLFFMIFIYFITTSFVAIYMESFRLNSLKYGNAYDYRMLSEQKMEEIVKKPKKKFLCFYY